MENGTNGPRRGIDKNTEQPFLKANTHKKKRTGIGNSLCYREKKTYVGHSLLNLIVLCAVHACNLIKSLVQFNCPRTFSTKCLKHEIHSSLYRIESVTSLYESCPHLIVPSSIDFERIKMMSRHTVYSPMSQ